MVTCSGLVQEGDDLEKDRPLSSTKASRNLDQGVGGPRISPRDKSNLTVDHMEIEDPNPSPLEPQSSPLSHLTTLSPSKYLIERHNGRGEHGLGNT